VEEGGYAPLIDTRKTELVIFDLDGTLVDSRDDIAASLNAALEAVGAPMRADEDLHPHIGRPLHDMFADLLPADLHPRVEDACEFYRRHYFDNCSRRSSVYPGVVECLDALADVPLAIATTKRTFQAERVAEVMGLASHFDLVHGTDGIPYKPDPAVLFEVLERLDKPAVGSWMVGDTVHDLRAGRAAGMRTCAVTYGIGAPDELAAERPDLLLDTLADLPAELAAR
jgi:phosphoglycolate phosphatase